MRVLSTLLLLTACPAPVGDPADSDSDTDVVDTDTGSEASALLLDAEHVTLAPGGTLTVGWSVQGAGEGALPTASVDAASCVTVTVQADGVVLDAADGVATSCAVTLATSDSEASLTVDVEPDWGGRIDQWGEAGLSNYATGLLPLEAGHVLVVGRYVTAESAFVGTLQRLDALGAPVGEPVELPGMNIQTAVRGDGATWLSYRNADGAYELVRVGDDGVVEDPIPLPGADAYVRTMGRMDGGIWVAGSLRHPDTGEIGVFVGEIGEERILDRRTLFSAEGSGIRLYGAQRLEDGWLLDGLTYDDFAPVFPEFQEEGEDWGSFFARTDEDLRPQWVQGIGPGNIQAQHARLLDDGRLLVAGWARDAYHVDDYTGGYDAVVELREQTGELVWRRVWGGTPERAFQAFEVRDGVAFVTGWMAPAMREPRRAWMIGLDLEDGTDVWEETLGTGVTDIRAMAPHGQGMLLLGYTTEALGGPLSGESDMYLARFSWDGLPR